jgi:hypothetical protein
MNHEIDVNVLMNSLTERMTALYKENAILDAKYQSLLLAHQELVQINNELQDEINSKLKEQ